MGLQRKNLIAGVVAALMLAACGDGPTDMVEEAAVDRSSPGAAAYYAEHPEFFTFASLEDLPGDLPWENGADLPDIGSPEARKGGTWNMDMQDFPRTFRTVGPDANGGFRQYLLDSVSTGSAARHPDQSAFFYPLLAKRWAISRETRTVYIAFNPEATWSDGVAITADDMMFMFYFYQSKFIQAPWYNNWYGQRYSNITKYDAHTFSVTLPDARPDMDARVLSLRPQPEHFYHDLGDDFVERYNWTFVPTTAPYVIADKDIKKGRSITLTRNDAWWARDNKFVRNRFNPDRIRMTVIRDMPKRFEAFRKGDLDRFNLDLSEYWYDKLPDSDADVQAGYIHKSKFFNQRPRRPYGLFVNTQRAGLDDLNLRLGLQHAANWDVVTQRYYRGDAERLQLYWSGYGRFSNPDIKARAFSVDKALGYFAKAGFETRGDDGILRNGAGKRLSFQLTSDDEALKDILTILKEEAAKAGVELRLEILDDSAGWKKVREKNHEIMFTAFTPSYEPYPRFWEFYAGENAFDVPYLEDGVTPNPQRKPRPQTSNYFGFADPEVDAWIEAYRASGNEEDMLALTYKIQNRLQEQAVFIPGFVNPFYRTGSWRWLRYPDGFNTRISGNDVRTMVHWIDEDMKAETRAARKSGKTFPAEINIYDQFKQD